MEEYWLILKLILTFLFGILIGFIIYNEIFVYKIKHGYIYKLTKACKTCGEGINKNNTEMRYMLVKEKK